MKSIGAKAFFGCSGLKKTIWLTYTPPSGYKNVIGAINYVSNELYKDLDNKKVYSSLSYMFEVDGIKYVPVSPSERTCDAIDCNYDESAENVNIENTVSYMGVSMTVKQVMPYACYGNKNIKKVQLDHSGGVGEYAFYGCTALQIANINNKGSIGSYAFYGCTTLQTAIVRNQDNIGSNAFSGCTALQIANINNKGSIGSYAFENSGVKELTIGSDVTAISDCAFLNCQLMQTAVLGDNIVSIDEGAFRYCSGLTSITIGSGVTSIGASAFSGCSGLKKIIVKDIAAWCSIYFSNIFGVPGSNPLYFAKHLYSDENTEITDLLIPNSVTSIGSSAFYGCSGLTSITIPNSVTSIGGYAFSNCSGLTSVTIPNSVTSIGGYAFSNCSGLTSVTIGNSVTSIGSSAFSGCIGLTSITIPNSVTTIGDLAFSGCSSLDYFACGLKVTSIGKEAFSDCTAMTKLISRAATPPVCGAQALDDINKFNCTLQVPEASIPVYQAADQWKDFFFIEPTGINEIKEDTTRQYRYYDLNGNLLLQPHKGVNILKSSNGKTKKVLVK